METSENIKHTYSLYKDNENQKLLKNNINFPELMKANETIHTYFHHKVSIKLHKDYVLIFKPITQDQSGLVGNFLTKNSGEHLQDYINILRFVKIVIKNKKHKHTVCDGSVPGRLNSYILRIMNEKDDFNKFVDYKPDFINYVLRKLNEDLKNSYEHIYSTNGSYSVSIDLNHLKLTSVEFSNKKIPDFFNLFSEVFFILKEFYG